MSTMPFSRSSWAPLGSLVFGGLLVLPLAACSDHSGGEGTTDDNAGTGEQDPNQAWIGPEGGRLELLEGPLAGLVIDVPPGAVDELTLFSAKLAEDLELDEYELEVGPAAELEPHGLEFHAPVIVTMPLTATLEPNNPVLMYKEGEGGRQLALPEDPTEQLDGRIRVRVGEFSSFQPFQRKINELLAEAVARATCENLEQLEALANSWAPHIYFYEGVSLSETVFGLQALGGVDAVYDLYHSQIGSFWYVGLGLYTTILGGAGTYYAGWGIGDSLNVQKAWSGNFVGVSGDVDLASAFTGFLGLSAGIALFTSCTDLSADPDIPNDRFCYPEEVEAPWNGAVFGAAGTVGVGINAFPEFGVPGNIGVTDGWWTGWKLYNSLLSKVIAFGGVPHDIVYVDTKPPAVDDTATFLQINSPDGSETGRGKLMARAILISSVAPFRGYAAEIAILQGLARDASQTLAQYCATQPQPSTARCVHGQLSYYSSNNCISGPASGVADLYRWVDNERVLEGQVDISADGSFCAQMNSGELYEIVQEDLDGSVCGPGYLVSCAYYVAAGVGTPDGACASDSCEDLGAIEFDCGS